MHKITLLLFLTICTYPSIQAQEKALDKKYAYVDSLLNDFLAKTKVAGFSVAVYKSNQQLYAKGFGYADVVHRCSKENRWWSQRRRTRRLAPWRLRCSNTQCHRRGQQSRPKRD